MNISSRLTVGECPGAPGHWYVDWTELSPVEKDIAKHNLCRVVFDVVRPKWHFGIGYNVEYYRLANPDLLYPRTTPHKPEDPVTEVVAFATVRDTKWEIFWLSYVAWQQLQEHQYAGYGHHLFRSGERHKQATGVVLETLDQAEQFVHEIEKQFTFYSLKKEYA